MVDLSFEFIVPFTISRSKISEFSMFVLPKSANSLKTSPFLFVVVYSISLVKLFTSSVEAFLFNFSSLRLSSILISFFSILFSSLTTYKLIFSCFLKSLFSFVMISKISSSTVFFFVDWSLVIFPSSLLEILVSLSGDL